MPSSYDDVFATLDESKAAMDDARSTPTAQIQGPQKSPYEDVFQSLGASEDARTKERLRGAVSTAGDPAEATEALRLFGKTNLPLEFIKRNLPFVKSESEKQGFDPDTLMKDSPAFASWLAESPDHAAAVKNDVTNLSYLERHIRRIKDAAETGPLLVELADIGNKSFDGTITPKDRARQEEIESRLHVLGRSRDENDTGVLFEFFAKPVEQAPIFLRSLGGKVEYGAKGLVAGTAAGAAVGSAAGPAGTAAGAVGGGTVAGLAGWRYGAAIEAGKIERGHALLDYEKLKDEQGNPLDQTTIKGLSLMAGAINGALEGLTGVEALANKLPGVRNIVRGGVKELLKTPTARGAILSMAKQVGDTMLTEGVTEALQMYVTKAGGVLAQWAVDGGSPVEVLGKIFSKENLAQAVEEFKGGAQGAGGTSVALMAPSVIQDVKQVRQAQQNQRAFEAMGKAAESSQFARDLPDHLKEIVKRATKDGAVQEFYAPAEQFNTYFQSQGADPREVYKEVTGSVEAYDQAMQTGQDLPIRVEDYASKLAGTPHNAFLARELRTAIDAMNAREAEEWQKEMDAQEQAAQESIQAASATDPLAKIRQDIAGQMQAFASPDVIEQYAGLMAERYQVRAQRRGLGEDPAELFKKLNLQVSTQLPDILTKLGKQQTELDALLNRLRVGDLPKESEVFGQSLGDFLREKGGLQDQGGELSALGVDEGKKPFKKKLIQKGGKGLDDAATAAFEAGYIASPNIPDLLSAIEHDVKQAPVYAIGRENARLLDVQHNLEALRQYLADREIDLSATTNEQIKAMLGEAVQQSLPAVEGQTFAQPAANETVTVDGIERPANNSNGHAISHKPKALEAFWRWFQRSKAVDEQGRPLVLYHGTKRADRIGNKFSKKRATSGPMAFFTDDKGIASKYSIGKPDTSISLDDRPYETWFKFKPEGHRSEVNIDQAWYFLTQEQRQKIAELAPRVGNNDDGTEHVLHDAGHTDGLGSYDYDIKQYRGNALRALVEGWLNSGALFNSEEEFLDVLKLAGFPGRVTYDDPHAEISGVIPVYLSIQNPLLTNAIPAEVVTALEAASKRQRRPKQSIGADAWDKRTRNAKEWMAQLQTDLAEGKNSFVWTSIPDWVTETLQRLGYDGIQDTGGKLGGEGHDVWVPFEETQVKSALGNRGTFVPTKANILHQGDGSPKGSITFGDNLISIKLLEKADLSTFIHESGHLYLNELIDDATTAGTSEQLRTDLDTILKWMGLEVTSTSGKDAIKAAIETRHHEQFARGFEAYAMEGKSPSIALREAFARFRQWLIQVYRSLTTSPLNVKLTKEVRESMDRLVATDEAIDQAAEAADVLPMFTDAESAGMTPTQWQAYQDLVAKASLTARETLQTKLMKQYQREQQAWWKEKREVMQATVTQEVNEEPEYIALAVLKTGKMPDGSEIPHGIPPMKLDKKGLADVFGKDFLKRLPKGLTAKDGMHHDAVAQLFGFSNGQDFVMALVNARDKGELIDAETDRRMKVEYGDMRFDGTLAEEAKAAVLNEHQEQVIQAELKAINAKRREVAPLLKAAEQEQKTAQRKGRDLLATMTPTLEDTRTLARNIMSRMAIKNINANHYSIAARQASRKATAAIAKQDWVQAGHFKQQELLNLALFREAGIVKERIESARELAKSFFKADATLAKSRNVDLVNVGRAILAQYGFGTQTEKTAAEYLEPIQKYDQDLYNQWKPQVDALAPRPLSYRALTVQEFTKLAEDLDALWLLSRRTQQVMIEGRLMDRADMIDLLTAEIESKAPSKRNRILGDQTAWEDTKLGLLSLGSALRRVESWVDAMDGGNINGIFRRFIWTPIQDAAVTFRTEKAKLLKQYLEIVKPIEATMTRDLIPANELGEGFAFRGKAALLHAILHTGNDSNKAKLLKGYGWDDAQWDAFLTRAWFDGTLTKADYDYAQGVWDLLESIKPQAQQAHHEMYGYYFSEITASPIQTPWGEYKGGYVPAIADSVKSVDQAIRQEKDLFDQAGNSFMFPTTGRGFTKARVEQYAAPLALNLATIPIHLDKVMRFVHLEPRVKDAARLVTNKQLRASLDALNPTVAKDMLVPWLQRAAQQTVSSPGKNRHMDRFWRALRARTGSQIMVGNVVNTLQQFTGFSLSLVKVKAKYLRGGLATYLKGPPAMADMIHEKSPFMAQRTTTQIMDMQASIDEILLNPTKYEEAKSFMMKHGYFMQQGTQNIVDLITWAGAYDQQIADGADEKEAVRAADSAVRQTQGSFDPESLSSFESGTPFVRAFTMFYSYFNMQANLLGTEFQKVVEGMGLKKGAGRAFYLYFIGFLIPAVLAETIVASLGGFDPDDEDGYLTETLSVLFGSQIRSALAFFPGVGPVALAGINAFNSKWYDDRISTSPVVSLIESASRAPHSLYKAMSEDGHSKRAVRDVLTLLGLVTGTPASALNRPVGYLADVYDGVATPENALDMTRGLISGKDVNRTK